MCFNKRFLCQLLTQRPKINVTKRCVSGSELQTDDPMEKTQSQQLTFHYTRWVFYTGARQLPRYAQPNDQPFFIASIYERSGPAYVKHLMVHLN